MFIRTLYILTLLVLFSCSENKKGSYSFYYWKSNVDLSEQEKNFLKGTSIVYAKYFDVKWQEGKVIPVAKITFHKKDFQDHTIIPVIFITNSVFENIEIDNIGELAHHIVHLIDEINRVNSIVNGQEIQIDCDWTDATQVKYFTFLRLFKAKSAKKLAATIRLHQIKYKKRTGIPPCDKGVLMYYNMGKLGKFTRKSIYNEQDAALYLKFIPYYPLKLMLALPIFKWAMIVRNDKVIALFSKLEEAKIKQHPQVKATAHKHYLVTDGMYMNGFYFHKNDQIIIEEMTRRDVFQAAKQVAVYLPKQTTILLFDLDSTNLTSFSNEDFSEIASFFY